MPLRTYLKLLRVRDWLGYLLIATLGYVVFTKLATRVLETLLFYVLVCLYLGFSFSINNCFDVKEDLVGRKNNPIAEGEIKRKKGIVFSLLLASLGMVLSFLRGLSVFYYSFLLTFLSFSYSSPPLRLKSEPFLDLISHGLFFGSLLFLFPSAFFFKDIKPLHAFLALSLFHFSVILELRNHIEDYESDKEAGLRTTACVLGLRMSKKLAYYLSLLFPFSLLPAFFLISEHVMLFLIVTTIFYLAFRSKRSYRVLDIYANVSYFLVMISVL